MFRDQRSDSGAYWNFISCYWEFVEKMLNVDSKARLCAAKVAQDLEEIQQVSNKDTIANDLALEAAIQSK